jgi:hypothetical protein
VTGGKSYAMQIIVGAKDKASAVLSRLQGVLARLRAPLDKLRGALRMTGVEKALGTVWRGTRTLATGFLDAARNAGILGAAGATALGALVAKITGAGDRTIKLARQMGVSAETLQEWRYAAEQAGVPAEKLDTATAKLATRIAQARAGYGEAREALYALGIQLTDSEGRARGVGEVLPEIADALARVSDEGARMALATPLFEEDGVALVRMMQGGSEGLAAAAKAAREAGAVTATSTLEGFERFQAQLTDLKTRIGGLATQLTAALLPAVQKIAGAFQGWLTENQEPIKRWIEWFGHELPFAIEGVWNLLKDFWAWFDGILDKAAKLIVDVKMGFRELRDEIEQSPGKVAARAATAVGRGGQELIDGIPILSDIQRFLNGGPPRREAEPDNRQGSLRVEFLNAPRGTRVTPDRDAARTTTLSVGYAMPEVGLA